MRRYFLLACAATLSAPVVVGATSPIDLRSPRAFVPKWNAPKAETTRIRPPVSYLNEGRNDAGPIFEETFASTAASAVSAELGVRGGACDSEAIQISMIAVGTALEAAALLGVLCAGTWLSTLPALSGLPTPGGMHLAQWICLVLVVYASSLIGSVIEGGLSAASNQVLDPNMTPGDPGWYDSLNRPSWEPPGWVFPIMWLIVSKPTQVAALSRLFKLSSSSSGKEEPSTMLSSALVVYCSHLALGDTWNKVFFGFQCPGKGAIVISTFLALLVTSAALFWSIDETAGKLMLPTCAWVSIASALNWWIYLNN